MKMVNVALPKGRLGEKVYAMFEKAGFECPSIKENNRKLIFENEEKGVLQHLIEGKELIDFTADTVIGSLSNYIATPNSNFVPMNANFCLVNDFLGRVKKKERKSHICG